MVKRLPQPLNRGGQLIGVLFCSILLTMISEDNWPLNKGCSIIIWLWYFIFCRYIFKNQKKAGLQELGPRFTLKLRSLQRGSFDSKFGEYEWVHKVSSIELLVLPITLRLCSHASGDDSCQSLNVNSFFFWVLIPEFGYVVLTLYLGTWVLGNPSVWM